MRTLVIEDSASGRQLLCDYLRKIGIAPIAAVSGNQGIALFEQQRPDLVLLDATIPDINSLELVQRIRHAERAGEWTPVYLFGPRDSGWLERAISAGADDYLCLPVNETILASKIRATQRIVAARQYLVTLTKELESANQELKRVSGLDPLTGIANRRQFDIMLLREWRRAMRQGEELSVLMCNVDAFTRYNETYGTTAGDDCLRRVAKTLAQSTDRGGDLLARYGGGQFAAVLPATAAAGATCVAEQMRLAVNQLELENIDASNRRVTLSFGVASAVAMPETYAQDLVDVADIALYTAKQRGGNQVCHIASLDPQLT
ncbi:diguanylate cyclase domain-containing protein [Propionivibrio soli]|uniref:GGDEF domain-containing response regulator n=1 Tax=Propionivibrio soli TaxID=2976531 RepID=UPI0021E9500A|nr:diguanylate cyclase [Propionivibrio soli]